MKKMLLAMLLTAAVTGTVHVLPAWADTPLESLTVMALGPLDGRAVVKTEDGKMQVLKVGDAVPGAKAVVVQVLTDRLVVEETIERPGEAPMKQTVWIYKPTKAGGPSRVQRLDRQGPEGPELNRPSTFEQQSEKKK